MSDACIECRQLEPNCGKMSNESEQGPSAGNAESVGLANSSNHTGVVTVEKAESVSDERTGGAVAGTASPRSGNENQTNRTSLLLTQPWDRTYGQVLRLSGVPEKGSRKKRELVYACFMGILVVGWAIIHFIYVIRNDVNMRGRPDPGRYNPLYIVAFVCPQLDGILNVAFAHYVIQAGVRLKVRFCHVLDDVASDIRHELSEKEGKQTVWWLLVATTILVPMLLLLERQLHGNRAVLKHLIIAVEHPHVQIEHLAELYEHFFEFTRRLCKRWQTMIILSLALELYAAVFQSIWIRWGNMRMDKESVVMQISLQALIQTSFMLFKIWPMAAFNSMVATFPNRVLRATARSESHRQAGQVLAGLFSTGPPTFTLLHFTPSWRVIIVLVISSLTSQFSRYVFKAFSGGLASDLVAAVY